jgi:perosamine synthetase
MERIDELICKKREVFSGYYNRLAHFDGISMNTEKINTVNGYWMPTVIFDSKLNINRELIMEKFGEENIDGRVFFYPLTMMDMFEKRFDNNVSYGIYSNGINLPTYHDIKTEDIERVTQIIVSFLE